MKQFCAHSEFGHAINDAFCFRGNGDSQVAARRLLRDRSSTAFVNQQTQQEMRQFLTLRFFARKTFNQRGLHFLFLSRSVGSQVASFGFAGKSAVVDYFHQPLVGSGS
jgi:hypothetical protein